MQSTLFSDNNTKEVIERVTTQLQTLQGQGIVIQDRTVRLTIRDVVCSLYPSLLFHPRMRLVDEVYEEIKDEKI